jgi:hypothetical protein
VGGQGSSQPTKAAGQHTSWHREAAHPGNPQAPVSGTRLPWPAEPVRLRSVNAAALIVAIVSVAIAAGGVLYGRRSARASETSATAASQSATSSDRAASAAEQSVGEARRSAGAAERSAEAAAVTAQLDTDRRHSELTPQLRIECEPGGQGVQMTVTFKGPAELRRLDELAVRVRNDHAWRGRGSSIAAGPSPEQAAAHVWGPLRFAPGSALPGGTGPDEHGRTIIARAVPVEEPVMFVMEPTRPPKWSASSLADWQRDMGALLRLELTCQAPGWEPWTATCEGPIISGRGTMEVPQRG